MAENRSEARPLGAGRVWNQLLAGAGEEILPVIRQREIIFRTPYETIWRVTADFGDNTKQYYVNDTGVRAGIVVDRDGAILLVRQYRLLIDGIAWEIPGGAVDPDESPADSAVRECLEETGIRCFNPQPLLDYLPGLDTRYNPTHVFYCTQTADVPEPQHIHVDEVRGIEWVPLAQCIEMIFDHRIMDNLSVLALLAYQTRIIRA